MRSSRPHTTSAGIAAPPSRWGKVALYMYGRQAMRKVISRLRSHCSSWGVVGSAPKARSKAAGSLKPARA